MRSGGREAVTMMESKKGSAKEDLHEGWCGDSEERRSGEWKMEVKGGVGGAWWARKRQQEGEVEVAHVYDFGGFKAVHSAGCCLFHP